MTDITESMWDDVETRWLSLAAGTAYDEVPDCSFCKLFLESGCVPCPLNPHPTLHCTMQLGEGADICCNGLFSIYSTKMTRKAAVDVLEYIKARKDEWEARKLSS